MGARTLTAAAALAAALATAVGGCAGPRVDASDVRVAPAPRPGMQRVQATLRNRGGKGEVKAKVRLRAGDRLYNAEQSVDVERGDRVELVVDVPAPPGDYTAAVSIDYPPE